MFPFQEIPSLTMAHVHRLMVLAYEVYYHEALNKRITDYRFASFLQRILDEIAFNSVRHLVVNQSGITLVLQHPIMKREGSGVHQCYFPWELQGEVFVVGIDRFSSMLLRLLQKTGDDLNPRLLKSVESGDWISMLTYTPAESGFDVEVNTVREPTVPKLMSINWTNQSMTFEPLGKV